MAAFPDGLNEQVGHEFAASQQYVAIAVGQSVMAFALPE